MTINDNLQIVYFKDGAINPDLVDKIAKGWADKIYPADEFERKRQGKQKMTAAQLRRFYGDIKGLEMRWKNSQDKHTGFLEILPLIKLLKAKVAYALKRDVVSENFKDYIWKNVELIKKEDDLKAFLLFFEGVVGFCYANGIKDNG